MTTQAKPVYPTAGIRALEQRFLPGAQPPLMERAGAGAAALAMKLIASRPGPVLVMAGPGNNGGDGLVLARVLRESGREVAVAFAGDAARLPDDARAAHALWLRGGATVAEFPAATRWALAVDALFGIGLGRPIDGRLAQWVEQFNHLPCPRLAIDIPSGLDADTGGVLGVAVRATHTITFIALKPGLLTRDGPDHCGAVSVHHLDLAVAEGEPAPGWTVAPELFAAHLVPRIKNSHKGLFGDVGIVGGAGGMVGAALLAGRAALRLGAGRVYVGLAATHAPAADTLQPELMLRTAEEALQLGSVLVVGPGLGHSEAARRLLEAAIARAVPLLLDADALNLVAARPVLAHHLERRNAPTLVTPHPAEAARLLGVTTPEVQADRLAAAAAIASRLGAHTVLKGCGSVLAAPDGRWWINTTGNPGMASAGMGDVLSGMGAALLAQGWSAEAALLGAVHLHGAAADTLVAGGEGPVGLAAGELIDAARRLLNRLLTPVV